MTGPVGEYRCCHQLLYYAGLGDPFVHLSQQLAETQHQEEMGRLRQELQVASKVQRPTEQTDFFVGFAKGWASYDH